MQNINKKIWLMNDWFKGWNPKKTAFGIQSPWNNNGVIWIYRNYYLNSKYDGWFGVEVNLKNFRTNEEHFYQEIIYSLHDKKINYIKGEKLANFFEDLNQQKSQTYRDFVASLSNEKIFD